MSGDNIGIEIFLIMLPTADNIWWNTLIKKLNEVQVGCKDDLYMSIPKDVRVTSKKNNVNYRDFVFVL